VTPWEAEAHALAVALSERGAFTWEEWTQAVGAAPEGEDRWVTALERLVVERGLAGADALARYREAWARAAARTPHGKPIELTGADFA
jgi:hypothetical protein